MQVLVIVGATLLGLVLGSFANVPIHRWPRGGTVGEPKRSACPECGATIRARDNVPVVSWLLLRGRCRSCGATIPARYLVVEVATGALFGATAAIWGLDPLLPALLVFVWALVVATAIDLEHRIIPNRLTLRLPLVLAPLIVAAAAISGDWSSLRGAALGFVIVPGVMFGLSELYRLVRGKAGMGMGDVKLAMSIGLVVGYLGGMELAVFAYASVISAVIIALVLMAIGRAKLASRIPFGPYLAVGSIAVLLAREPLTDLMRAILGL